MFETIAAAPPDPILGLTEAFAEDLNPRKINLGVGIYKDESGKTPVLASVKEAERRLLDQETSKNYLPIEGDRAFAGHVQQLLFGGGVGNGAAVTAQCPGGTGALRVAADYLKANHPDARVWLSDPTWPNHPSIFEAAGVFTHVYPYFDPETHTLAIDRMLDGLAQAKPGDVVVLHGCCHNPTGADPSPEQWQRIARFLAERKLVPLVDFAYQGFGDGIDQDATGLRKLAQQTGELFVCSSFSKNFGLYNERVGALTALARSPDAAHNVLSQFKVCIRRNYSNPPAHGAKVVATVLGDSDLRKQWEAEVAAMRDRIHAMRRLFVDTLEARGARRDFSFIAGQKGMFSFSGLTRDQVARLRAEHSVYIVGSGRISVAGMTRDNMDPLCAAIVNVL